MRYVRPVCCNRAVGALVLSSAPARERCVRCRRESVDRSSARAAARSRMGYPQPQQRIPATRTQRRTLYAIPYDRWTYSTSGRRVGVGNAVKSHLDRADRHDRDDESARGQRAPYFHDLPDAGSADGASRGVIGAAFGAILPFVVSWLFGAIIPLPLAPALHPGNCCWLYSMGY